MITYCRQLLLLCADSFTILVLDFVTTGARLRKLARNNDRLPIDIWFIRLITFILDGDRNLRPSVPFEF